MATAELQHLIKMVNQIAKNIAAGESQKDVIEKTAGHIQRFWAGSMKREIVGYVECGGEGLDPLALSAVQQLSKPSK
jgi:formate dehydrogenase subunit delta